jgi:hypothetical protein
MDKTPELTRVIRKRPECSFMEDGNVEGGISPYTQFLKMDSKTSNSNYRPCTPIRTDVRCISPRFNIRLSQLDKRTVKLTTFSRACFQVQCTSITKRLTTKTKCSVLMANARIAVPTTYTDVHLGEGGHVFVI